MDANAMPAETPAEATPVRFFEGTVSVEFDDAQLKTLIDILSVFQVHRDTILASMPAAPSERAYATNDREKWAWAARNEITDLAGRAGAIRARLTQYQLIAYRQEAFPDGQDDH